MHITPMASEVHSGNEPAAETPETEVLATGAVETERTVEAAPEPVAVRPMVTELAPVAEMTIPLKTLPDTAAEIPQTETEFEVPATAAVETERTAEAAPEKEAVSVGDQPMVTIGETTVSKKKRTRWPGDCVFRVVVPVLKAGSIIGRNGDLIKKICKQTKAHIRVLEGLVCDPHRIFLVSGKEEIEVPLSPAMDAVIRIFKLVNGFPENESNGVASIPFCSIRLLVPSMQSTSLIGKLGLIHENTGCCVRVLSTDEVSPLSVSSDDRVVDLQGEPLKVFQALEAVLGHLRMFLVDHNVHPQFKKTQNATVTREKCQVVTRVEKSMVARSINISLVYAVDIIGVGGANIVNIGRTSGAKLVVLQTKGLHNQITVQIKGTKPQVQTAQYLIQDLIKKKKETATKTVATATSLPPHVTAAPSGVGMEGISESKRSRVSWENENVVKTFLDACIHEIAINGREGGSLTQVSWKQVGEVLKECHNFSVDFKQMKNHFEELKNKYRAWLLLKNKMITIYDPSTNAFSSTDKKRKNVIKINKYMRNISLLFPDLCAKLFDGAIEPHVVEKDEPMPTIEPYIEPHVVEKDEPVPTIEPHMVEKDEPVPTIEPHVEKDEPIPNIEPHVVEKDEPIPPIEPHMLEEGELEPHLVEKDEPIPTIEPQMVEKNEPMPIIEPHVLERDEAIPTIEPHLVEKDEPLPTIEPHMVKDDEETIILDNLSLASPSSFHPLIEKKQKEGEQVVEKEILGVLRMIADKMNKPEPPPKPTFEDCEKKLKKLRWPRDDFLNVVAYGIFCDENDRYRECWMNLKPEMCAAWVQMIGRSKGFIF